MATRGLHVVITGDPRGFQAALAKAGGDLGKFGAKQKTTAGKLSAAGKGMSKSLTLPLVAAAGVSVKLAADFEKQMSSLGAVADAPAAQLEKLRKQALKAGADTAYSAKEAAVAQTELAKGGIGAADILKGALGGALSLAAAGELELGEAASTTANALNLFGMGGDKAGHVADALAMAANATTADVSDFGMALKAGGAVAKSAGLSFDETVVALEALAASGVKNSDAGTSLKAALIGVLKPSDKTAAVMDKLGLKFTDNAGNMKSLGGISQMLRDRLGGMTKAQRTATLAQVAGTDGVRTLLAIMDAGPKRLKKYADGVHKTGTASEVAKKKQDNFAGKLEQLKGSLETLGIIVGTTLLPPLTALAVKLTSFANTVATAFSSLTPHQQQLVLGFVGLVAAAGPMLIIGAKLVTAFNTIRTAMVAVRGAQLGLRAAILVGNAAGAAQSAAMLAWRGAIMVVRGAMLGLRAVMLGMRIVAATAFGPIGLAVMGLATVAILVVTHWKQVKGALSAVWNALKSAAGAAFGFVKKLATTGLLGPIPLILSRWKQVKSALGAVWGAIKSAASSAFNALKGIVSRALNAAVGAARAVLGAFKAAGTAVGRGFVSALRAVLGAAKAAASAIGHAVVAGLRAIIGAVAAAGKFVGTRFVSGLRNILGAARNAATAIGRAVINGLKSVVSGAVGIGKSIVQGLINGIKALAGAAMSAASDLVGNAIKAAKKKLHIGSPSKVTHEMGEFFSEGLANGIGAGGAGVRAAARAAGDGMLFELDGAIAAARKQRDELDELFDFTDKQRALSGAQSKVDRLGGFEHVGAKRRTTGKGLKRDQRDRNVAFNRKQESHAKHNDEVRDARKELADLTEQANRAQQSATIDFKVAGLERLKAFGDAMASTRESLKGVVDDATSSFRAAREKVIDSGLDKALLALDDSFAGGLRRARLGLEADPRVAELQKLNADAEASKRGAEDAEIADRMAKATKIKASATDRVTAAEQRLAAVQSSGSLRLIGDAQRRLDAAKAAAAAADAGIANVEADRKKLQDERRAAELTAEVENARTIAEDTAAAQREGLDAEEQTFRDSLQQRLNDEAAQLESRKQTYAQFAADVGAILGPLGMVFTGDADAEAAIGAPEITAPRVPGAKPKKKPKKKPKPRHRASGGITRFGELTRAHELGAETMVLPTGTRITPASRSDDPVPSIGQLIINAEGAAARDPHALAAFVGFQVSTRRR